MKFPQNKRNHGFTLIEIMVVVGIIGILAAIALPSYQEFVRKSNRAAAQGCILSLAQWMERYYTTNLRYDQNAAGAAVVLPNMACTAELAGKYTFGLSGAATSTTFALQAVPQGVQASDSCGTLTVNETGARTPTTSACWD